MQRINYIATFSVIAEKFVGYRLVWFGKVVSWVCLNRQRARNVLDKMITIGRVKE